MRETGIRKPIMPVLLGKYRISRIDIEKLPFGIEVNSLLKVAKAGRRIQGKYGVRQPPDVSTLKVIIPDKSFILVTIPKAGTKSIQGLFHQPAPSGRQYVNYRASLRELFEQRSEYESYFRACFVRNPWDRVASCYLNKIAGKPHITKLAILSRYSGLWFGMPFEAFVDWLLSEEGSDACGDRHWISQHRILTDGDKELQYDFIGRIEKIQVDWLKLCDSLSLPQWTRDLPHSNKSAGLSSYASLFNKRTAQLVAKRYEKDIELFEYRFDPSPT